MSKIFVITNLFLILCLIGIVVLGIFVRKAVKNKSANLFVGIVVTSATWVFFNILANVSIFWGETTLMFFSRATSLGTAFLPVFLIHFALEFPDEKKLKRRWAITILYLVSLATVPFVFTKYNLESVEINLASYSSSYEAGPLVLVNAVYLLISILFVFVIFRQKAKRLSLEQKRQVWYVSSGLILSVLCGLFLGVLLPLFGRFEFVNAMPAVIVLLMIFSFVAILKYNLFNIKVVLVEIITGFLSLFLFLYIFDSADIVDIIIRTSVFVIVAIFSLLLTRNVLREIHDKERLAALTTDLEKANQRLQKLDKTKSEFLSIASHQLRTPISGIKGYLSMMLEGDFGKIEDKPKEIMKSIYDNTERLNGLVNDFLDVSRIERGKLVMERQPTDMVEMVTSIVENFKPVASNKGLELQLITPKKPAPKIDVDPTKLRQVILNLVDNALKYTHEGSVQVNMETLNDRFKVCVKDTGVGLEPEEAKNLFKPFVRATDASKSNATGSGLGLYVARKIVQYHGGKVWAESEGKGKGSNFCVEVPFDQSSVPEPEPEPYLE